MFDRKCPIIVNIISKPPIAVKMRGKCVYLCLSRKIQYKYSGC
jgi:hypothetical protein